MSTSPDQETYRFYLLDLGVQLKQIAMLAKAGLEASRKRAAAGAGESPGHMFEHGRVDAFHDVIALMQNEAAAHGIPLADLRLDDLVPDRDLV